ncbi:hypothetical protein L218DRAFT_973346 [Marasmius fiardii PR-910]|nr:hypothetical protein L218DRAFT_973346 [Marasmius fiardii PR-910]
MQKLIEHSGKFNLCCSDNQVQLPQMPEHPPELLNLFIKVDQETLNMAGSYSFHMFRELHHRMSSLLPEEDGERTYAQLYIYDTGFNQDDAINIQIQDDVNYGLDLETFIIIEGVLETSHPYVRLFQHAYELLRQQPHAVKAHLRYVQGIDTRQYNLPTRGCEVAAIIPGSGEEDASEDQDLIVSK